VTDDEHPRRPAGTAPPDVAAGVEAATADGLARVASALLGEDPPGVCAALAEHAAHGPPPSIADPCLAALAPVGGGTAGPAGVLERFLRGEEADAGAVLEAIGDCRRRAADAPRAATLPVGPQGLAEALWRRGLLAAVREFWDVAARAYRGARPLLLAGEHAAAAHRLAAGRAESAAIVERIDLLAHRVAGTTPRFGRPPGDAGTGPTAVEERTAAPRRRRVPPAPRRQRRLPRSPACRRPRAAPAAGAGMLAGAGGTEAAAGAGVAETAAGAGVAETAAGAGHVTRDARPPRPVREADILSRRAPREHPFLPIVFLVLVTGAALTVLYAVVYGLPPVP